MDATGVWHEASSPTPYVPNCITYPNSTDGQFYNLAATSDGTMLNAYVNGVLIGSTDMTGSSTDTSLSNGSASLASGGGWTAGEWSVGRGLYVVGHSDRAYCLIDDVHISDAALDPSQCLASPTPEPAALSLAAIATAGTLTGAGAIDNGASNDDRPRPVFSTPRRSDPRNRQ